MQFHLKYHKFPAKADYLNLNPKIRTKIFDTIMSLKISKVLNPN